MSSEFPKSWTTTSLYELLIALESGSRPRGGVRGIAEGVPSVGGEHLNYNGGFDFGSVKFVPVKFADWMTKGHIQPNDILIVKDGATTGKTSFVGTDFPYKKAVVNEHVFICRPTYNIVSRFLFRYLMSKEGQDRILENFKGSAQGGINQTFASNTAVPLAPLPEQNRIVAKLEQLLERVERSRKKLERIPKLLKRFRQSVLAAACSGKLTEDWREENAVEEWNETTIDQIAERIQIGPFGTQLHKSDYISNGIPLINPMHVKDYRIVADNEYSITKKKYAELKNYHLKTNDIIMARRGEMGRCAIVTESENAWLCGTGSLFVRAKKGVFSKFLFLVLSNGETKEFLEGESKGTTMNNLNLDILRSIPISLPSFIEQQEIVRRVEQLFAFADKIEQRYTKAAKQVEKLTQSILAKAFRGELVPQDPNDPPASELLAKIKEERELAQVNTSTKRKKDFRRAGEPASVLLEKIKIEKTKMESEKASGKNKEQRRVDEPARRRK